MAKIGKGNQSVKQEKTMELTAEIKAQGGNVNFADLYDKIDAEKVIKTSRAGVSAEQVREIIDGVFDSGKTEVAVATVRDMVDIVYNLDKDHKAQNSSVRSAGTAGKKYKIQTISGNAYFVKV